MRTQVYTKINTLFCRYKNLGKVELPNKQWIKFQNKIILGDFSDDYMDYIKDLKFDCFSKIDGTNSKIVYLPSTGECFCGGKTDNADIIGTGQKAMLDQVIERIKPILAELFPPESARFTPVLNDKNQIQYYWAECGEPITNINEVDFKVNGNFYGVHLEEIPVYIYGEFYGKGVQKCGGNYDKDNKRFSVFDICQQGWWVPINILNDYCAKLSLDIAPYIGQMTIKEAEAMVMNGFKTRVANVSNPDLIEEGIVARPVVPIKDPRGNRIIVKIKYCDYKELNAVIDELGVTQYDEFHKWYMDNREAIESVK